LCSQFTVDYLVLAVFCLILATKLLFFLGLEVYFFSDISGICIGLLFFMLSLVKLLFLLKSTIDLANDSRDSLVL